jgi:hypothetical protein
MSPERSVKGRSERTQGRAAQLMQLSLRASQPSKLP